MNIIKTSVIAAAAITIVGCGSDSDSTPTTQVRVTHASPDAPLVEIKANGSVVSGLGNVDYQESSGVITLDAGTYDFSVDAKLPGVQTVQVLDLAGTNLAADMRYDVIAIDNVDLSGASPTIQGSVIARSSTAPSGDMARLSVLHAHPTAGAVDVYLTTDATLDQASPTLDDFAFTDTFSGEVPMGDVRIRVTGPDDKTVLFDTGEAAINLASGSDTIVVATENTRVGESTSPLTLLAGFGTAALSPVYSSTENATVRVAHSVFGLGGVDVNASGSAVDGLVNITFPTDVTISNFRSKDLPGATAFDLTVSPTGDPSTVAIDLGSQTFDAGSETTVFAVGNADGDPEAISALPIVDDMRSVSAYAKVRVVHAHPEAGLVDIHAVAAGGDFDTTTVVVAGVNFKDFTEEHLIINAGMYDLAVAEAGTTNVLLSLNGADLTGGLVATVFATENGIKVNVDNSSGN
ncbi:DUF4397 domain-containing protein [Vibrio sp. SCSIO 43140]|uniref:DUF4397 domain-containing protein n=1 Tax=Vibrio sp. SCSIO 43140 TaxID=2819100 RepID=UPI002075CB8C|nr:DUF4397 domain-containing protein [Vibrio sp. SCSIO 43140]USD61493.1 DUF4397 domain-containing protein [Vibrio sp. SCSIO 43140]